MSLTGIEVGDHDNKWAITLQTIHLFHWAQKKQMYNFWGETPGTKVGFPWVPHNSHVG